MKQIFWMLLFSVSAFCSHKSTHYVFVKGFLSEGNYFYLTENINALRKLGISQKQIHIVSPSSTKSVDANIQVLKTTIDSISEQMILIPHSMGGSITYRYLLRYFPEIKNKIKGIFFIQSALGGSRHSELAFGVGNVDSPLYTEFEKFCLYYASRSNFMRRSCLAPALFSMTERQSLRFLDQAYKLEAMSHQIFYIISSQDPALNSPPLNFMGKFLSINYGANDGIILEEDQWIAGLGKILKKYTADHAGLVCTWPVSRAPRRLQQDMMKSIVEKVKELTSCSGYLISHK